MITILTSSPSGPLDKPNDERLLDESNGFVSVLKKYWKENMRALIICATPNNYYGNDEMRQFFEDAFRHSGVPVTSFDLWDKRVSHVDLHNYDFIMLGGGHVPTQNMYFQEINLKNKLKDYQGIVMGVSAGSMNAANVVYAQPELEGESSPNFNRYLEGLNLTKINVLPHYQMIKNYYLDGKRLFEDLTYPDSYKQPLYCLCDGSYIVIEDSKALLYGEAYKIENGKIQIFNTTNNIRSIPVDF